jgi:peptidoglycan-associated lipoprotein
MSACGPAAPPADDASRAAANPSAAPTANATASATPDSPDAGNLRISSEITKACGDLPSAHFDFNSSELSPDASKAFRALATCFTTGPLKGRTLRLVGHADNRGELVHNFALGQQRAGSAASGLVKFGMDSAKIETSSRGELEATGTNEAGWAADRRVDAFLGK